MFSESWSKVPRVPVGQTSSRESRVTNGDMMIRAVLKFEVVSARTVDQDNEKKHVVGVIFLSNVT